MTWRLRFWLRAMDVFYALGGRIGSWRFRLYLWAVGKAVDASELP